MFTHAQRARLAYFREVMALDGGRHALFALGRVGERIVSVTMLGRTGSCFSDADVQAMTSVVPILGLATAAHEATAKRDLCRHLRPALDLRPRERDLVDYVALGFTNAEIGTILGTSPRTVRNQLSALYARIGASNRAELIALCHSRDRS